MRSFSSTITTTAGINDVAPQWPCEFTFTREVEYVRSETAVKADPSWHHTDSNGHDHAFVEGELSTLTAYQVHVPCDGTCGGICEGEGYTITAYRCSMCDEKVDPHWVPDDVARDFGVPVDVGSSWQAVVTTDRPFDGEVDLVVAAIPTVLRGVVTWQSMTVRHSSREVRITISGSGSELTYLAHDAPSTHPE